MKISQLIGSTFTLSGIVTLSVLSSPLMANAASFSNINGGDTVGDSLAPFLTMDVTSASGGGVLFKFNFLDNNTPFTTAFIRTVYIDAETSLLGTSGINVNSGNVGVVDFNGGLGNDNLPQGNNLDKDFTTDYAFNRISGSGNTKGIQKTESLGVLFSNADFNNVISAINGGTLRVGYHVQGIGSGSDSYVNATGTPTPVPVPSFLLGVVAAGALGGSRLLKNKKQVS
jgi:hypothetical protein